MSTDAKDEVARFLAVLGESGAHADLQDEVSALQVPDDIKALLMARDEAGLKQQLSDGAPVVSFVYITESIELR